MKEKMTDESAGQVLRSDDLQEESIAQILKSVLELRQRGRDMQLMFAGWRGLWRNVPMRRWERAQVMKQESTMKALELQQMIALRVVLRIWRRTAGGSSTGS